jgi:hypothetical protein
MLKTNPRELIERGWYLLPVMPNAKQPYARLAKNGHLSATNDINQFEIWNETKQDLNWGISCKPSNLVVIDFDYRNMGEQEHEILSYFERAYYEHTYTVRTGDGIHYYFNAPKNLKAKGKLLGGIDIKHNGYVLAEGSIHPNGQVYESLGTTQVIEIPERILRKVTK